MSRNYLILLLTFSLLFYACIKREESSDLVDVVEDINRASIQYAAGDEVEEKRIVLNELLNKSSNDVVISSNQSYMKMLKKRDVISNFYIIKENEIILAVNESVKNLESLEDIFNEEIKIGVVYETLLVGNYTKHVLNKLNVDYNGFSEVVMRKTSFISTSSKEIINEINLGNIDCGFVLATDLNEENMENIHPIIINKKYNINLNYYVGIIDDKLKENKYSESLKRGVIKDEEI